MPTKRAPDVWESARFRSIFLASSFSYISSHVHTRPHAGNASRWVLALKTKEVYIGEQSLSSGLLMEKASIIFSVLIHSDEFMYLFWGALGIINMSLGTYLLKSKGLGEKELAEISPKFKNINSDYMVFRTHLKNGRLRSNLSMGADRWISKTNNGQWSNLYFRKWNAERMARDVREWTTVRS